MRSAYNSADNDRCSACKVATCSVAAREAAVISCTDLLMASPAARALLRLFKTLAVSSALDLASANPTFATRGIEAAKLEVFCGVRSKGRHHTGRCHGTATSTEAILGDGSAGKSIFNWRSRINWS